MKLLSEGEQGLAAGVGRIAGRRIAKTGQGLIQTSGRQRVSPSAQVRLAIADEEIAADIGLKCTRRGLSRHRGAAAERGGQAHAESGCGA